MIRPRGWLWLIPTVNYSSAVAAALAFIFLVMDLFPLAMKTSQVKPAMEVVPSSQMTSELPAVQDPRITRDEEMPKQEDNKTENGMEAIGNSQVPAEQQKSTAENAMPGKMEDNKFASTSTLESERMQNQIRIPGSALPAGAALAPNDERGRRRYARNQSDMVLPEAAKALPTSFPFPSSIPSQISIAETASTELSETEEVMTIPSAMDAAAPPENLPQSPAAGVGIAAEAPEGTADITARPTMQGHIVSDPSLASPNQPSTMNENTKSAAQFWPASSTGGILLLISLFLGTTGLILKKRLHS